MGAALVLTSGYATNPSTTFTALTINSGESLTVPAFNLSTKAFLASAWSPGATVGVFRLRSPRFHDVAQGIRMQRGAAVFEVLMSQYLQQPLYPSDVITAEVTGGGAETDMGAFLSYFDDMPGIAARLGMPADVLPRIRNVFGSEVDVTSGATNGQYGTARALNFSFDTFKANTDYALLGYNVSVKVGVVCVYGPDTGNQHVGGPGVITPAEETRDWFVDLSARLGRPCIPIINSNNRGSTYCQIADVGSATASNVSLIFGELGS